MTPPPNFVHFWIILLHRCSAWIARKLFRHGDAKIGGRRQQADKDAESIKTGFRSPRGHKDEQMSALICPPHSWPGKVLPMSNLTHISGKSFLLFVLFDKPAKPEISAIRPEDFLLIGFWFLVCYAATQLATPL